MGSERQDVCCIQPGSSTVILAEVFVLKLTGPLETFEVRHFRTKQQLCQLCVQCGRVVRLVSVHESISGAVARQRLLRACEETG